MGLPVSAEQVEELRAHLDVTDDDMRRAKDHERRLRHDIMARIGQKDTRPDMRGVVPGDAISGAVANDRGERCRSYKE